MTRQRLVIAVFLLCLLPIAGFAYSGTVYSSPQQNAIMATADHQARIEAPIAEEDGLPTIDPIVAAFVCVSLVLGGMRYRRWEGSRKMIAFQRAFLGC
jgi:hypothetical protein